MQGRVKTRFTEWDALKALGSLVVVTLSGGLRRALRIEPRWLEQTQTVLPVRDLPSAWAGARVALLADLHAGRNYDFLFLQQVVNATNATEVDIVTIVGDTIDADCPDVTRMAGLLAELKAPLGKFAVLGNHDYDPSPNRAAQCFAAAGIDLIINASRVLTRRGQRLAIGGLDDAIKGSPDLSATFAGLAESLPRLLLCHNPDVAELIPPEARVDAMLCGHSHGGQVRLWLLGPLVLPLRHRKYQAGLIPGPRCPVYVSRGIGTVGMPLRYRCRPELAIITLQRAP